jgi:hypothetical protein
MTLTQNTLGQYIFVDSGGNSGNIVYLNPRICCQLANMGTPAGYCPIGVISQAYRKFCFTKLQIIYTPTSASTSYNMSFALAFDPEFIRTTSLGASRMAYANFECSMIGPIWIPQTLDVTRFLDRSKWFQAEVQGGTSPNDISGSQGVQGSIMLAPITDSSLGASPQLGMFSIAFELAMFELGPTEAISAPTLQRSDAQAVSTPVVSPMTDRPLLTQTGDTTGATIPPGYVIVKQQ